jgi:hypothetical protein
MQAQPLTQRAADGGLVPRLARRRRGRRCRVAWQLPRQHDVVGPQLAVHNTLGVQERHHVGHLQQPAWEGVGQA